MIGGIKKEVTYRIGRRLLPVATVDAFARGIDTTLLIDDQIQAQTAEWKKQKAKEL
jgi:hypothetical protein